LTSGQIKRAIVSMLVAIGLSSAGCVDGTTPPDVTPSPGSTGLAAPSASSFPTSMPTPSSSTAAAPLPLAGSWEGIAVVQGDRPTHITLSLHDCGPRNVPSPECGTIALQGEDGVVCSYQVQYLDPDNPGADQPDAHPRVALAPMADELAYYVTDTGYIDCEESWVVDAVLFVRPATDGTIVVSRVEGLNRDPMFTLDPIR
jgi:hypothetical protein